MEKIDTKDILFICGGAFDGIAKIIERRVRSQSIGFNALSKEVITKIVEFQINELNNNLIQIKLVLFGNLRKSHTLKLFFEAYFPTNLIIVSVFGIGGFFSAFQS